MKVPTGSRVMAWAILGSTITLTAYAINNNMENIATTIFITGIPSAVGLYVNKQWTEFKSILKSKPNAISE